jgi:hypothetical protein
LAAQGFLAAHGFFAAQGFFAAHGFLAAHGFPFVFVERGLAPQGLQGLAAIAPGAARATAIKPLETRDLKLLFGFIPGSPIYLKVIDGSRRLGPHIGMGHFAEPCR